MLILKSISARQIKVPSGQARSEPASESGTASTIPIEETPWKERSDYFQAVTGRSVDPRLMSFHQLGEGLIGAENRSGFYPDTKADRLTLNGLGSIDRVGEPTDIHPSKEQEVPEGLPFNAQRRSGEQYWGDAPQKPRRTQIF